LARTFSFGRTHRTRSVLNLSVHTCPESRSDKGAASAVLYFCRPSSRSINFQCVATMDDGREQLACGRP
jgi:hypothetical protein